MGITNGSRTECIATVHTELLRDDYYDEYYEEDEGLRDMMRMMWISVLRK